MVGTGQPDAHPPTCGHAVFHCGAIVSGAAVGVCVLTSVWTSTFIFLRRMPTSGFARSPSNSIFLKKRLIIYLAVLGLVVAYRI